MEKRAVRDRVTFTCILISFISVIKVIAQKYKERLAIIRLRRRQDRNSGRIARAWFIRNLRIEPTGDLLLRINRMTRYAIMARTSTERC